jgi:tetratricopeptide (TPR) repeat protein
MAARRSWPSISLLGGNLALYGVLAALVMLYGPQLRWAARELPAYLRGRIGSPAERRMAVEAGRLLRERRDLERARVLLERSAAIDPTGEAVYWLGEYHLAVGRRDEALARFVRYIELDPADVRSYLRAAAILELLDRPQEARETLEPGVGHFAADLERFRPRPDPTVAERFNAKAVATYEGHRAALDRLRTELRRLEQERTTSAEPGVPARATPP